MLTNIVRDAEYLTCVRPHRLHDGQPIGSPCSTSTCPRSACRGAAGASTRPTSCATSSSASGAGAGSSRAILRSSTRLAAGQSVAAIAQALGCTDRTVRNRRQRLVTKLQALSAADA